MKIAYQILFLITMIHPLIGGEPQTKDFSPYESHPAVDTKNVMATLGNILLVRTFEKHSDINSATSYIEAYDIYSGQRLWYHRNSGIIVSFLIANSQTLLLRTYGRITAVDLYSGRTLWNRDTLGEYSIIAGE